MPHASLVELSERMKYISMPFVQSRRLGGFLLSLICPILRTGVFTAAMTNTTCPSLFLHLILWSSVYSTPDDEYFGTHDFQLVNSTSDQLLDRRSYPTTTNLLPYGIVVAWRLPMVEMGCPFTQTTTEPLMPLQNPNYERW